MYLFKKLVEEIILASISPSYGTQFISNLYLKSYGPSSLNNGLFEWEKKAINSFFPQPPAKIFVGGAGAGRELITLSSQGYYLTGIEPIKSSAVCAISSIPKEKLLAFLVSSYETLVNGKPNEIEEYAPYDAVILGWGSFTHILDTNMHKLLLKKVRSLCPKGPILLSWLRAMYVGPKTKTLRKLLSCFGFKKHSDTDFYSSELGFHHRFSFEEIKELASLSGNKIVFYEDKKTYPHAVLLPVQY